MKWYYLQRKHKHLIPNASRAEVSGIGTSSGKVVRVIASLTQFYKTWTRYISTKGLFWMFRKIKFLTMALFSLILVSVLIINMVSLLDRVVGLVIKVISLELL